MAEKLPDSMHVGRGQVKEFLLRTHEGLSFAFDLLFLFCYIDSSHVCHLTGFRFAHLPQPPVSPLVASMLARAAQASIKRTFL